MGNLVPACYHPGRQLNDPEDALFLLSKEVDFTEDSTTSPETQYTYQTPAERCFLKPHRDDRPHKQLLDSMDVTIALLEQAEELLRRENGFDNLEETLKGGDGSDDEDSNGDTTSNLTGSGSVNEDQSSTKTGRSSSLRATNTFTTTVSAMTQPAKNLGPKSKKTKRSSKQNALSRNHTPQLLGGKTFEAQQQLQEQVHRALSLSARINLGKSYLRSAQRFNDSNYYNSTSQLVNPYDRMGSGSGGGPCGGLLMFWWLEDQEKFRHMQRVRQHMSALYLKLHSNCAAYYQKHLSRLLPDNPMTRAIANGMVLSSKLSTRPRNRLGDLGLLSSSDISSSSESSKLGGYGSGVNGGIQFGSVGPPSWPVHMLVTDTVFLDLALTGSLGLVDHRRQPPKQLSGVSSPLQPPEHLIVLLNRRSGVPLAVCGLKASAKDGPLVVRIYATKRRVQGQQIATTTRRLGLDWSSKKRSSHNKTSNLAASTSSSSSLSESATKESTANLPLYTWAEVVIEGAYPNPISYSIFMVAGIDGSLEDTASYFAVHESLGSPEVRVVGRTERDIPIRNSSGGAGPLPGCAVLSLSRDDEFDDDVYFRLAVAKGIDPALFTCFAAIVDEIMEKSMRTQAQMLMTETVHKKTRK